MSADLLSSFFPNGDVSGILSELQSRFVCQKCGTCCRVGGNPIFTVRDIAALAFHLDCSPFDKSRIPVEPRPGVPGLYDLTLAIPCFYQDKVTGECTIQEVKPQNCSEWPFISLARGMCRLDHVLVCPVATKMLYEALGVPCQRKSNVVPSVPRCLHQRADEGSLSVVCVINGNQRCPFAGKPDKEKCLGFVRVDPEDHPETGLP